MDFNEWIESAPEEVRTAPYIKPPEGGAERTAEQFVADLTNAANLQGNLHESHIGVTGLDDVDKLTLAQKKALEKIPGLMKLPGDDDEEGMTQLLTKLGRPEEPAGYNLPEGAEDALQGVDVDALKKRAHQNGLTQKQFKAEVSALVQDRTAFKEHQEGLAEQNANDLRELWGEAYTERKRAVEDFLSKETSVPKALVKQFEDGVLTAETVNFLFEVADAVSGELGQTRKQGDRSGGLTPGEATEQANALRAELSGMHRSDPSYAPKLAKLNSLMKKAFPSGGA